MSDSIKHTMLENEVNGITDIRAVKTKAAQFRAQMGTNLTYDQYCTLVLSAAQAYDAQHVTKETSCETMCSVYNSTIYHESIENDICESYNIDSSIFHLNDNNDNNEEPNTNNINSEKNQEHQLAIFNSTLTPYPRLSQSQWTQLSAEARSTWNTFDDADKTIILSTPFFVNPSNNNNRQRYQPRGNTRNQTYGSRDNGSRPFFSNRQISQ